MEFGEFKSNFIITICDVPETVANNMINEVGGEIRRHYNALCDVQFTNHKMRVYDNRVSVRNPVTRKYFILYFKLFSNIYIN